MNLGPGIRAFHRWTALLFMLTVIAASIAVARQDKDLLWITYLPLLPLALLTLTGMYLYFQPWIARWRRRSTA